MSSSAAVRSPTRIPSLDGVRAVAIALVVASHVAFTSAAPRAFADASASLHLGALGVRVFFVLSGFLITRLLLAERVEHGEIRLGRFYLRRTLRIFPPYYVYLAAVFAAAAAGWLYLPRSAAIHAVTYTTDYAHLTAWATGHGWSLAVEEQFYLVWPLALVLLGVERAAMLAAACVLAVPLVRLGYFTWAPGMLRPEFRFECVADSLAVGCLLAIRRDALWARPWYRRIVASRWMALAPLAVLALAALDKHPRIGFTVGIPLQNVGIALLIDRYVRFPAGRVGRVLNARPVVVVGLLSYSIYLWQQPFFDPAAPAWMTAAPWNLALVALTATGSYWLVERPAFRWRRRVERWLDARGAARHHAAAIAAAAPAVDAVPVGPAHTAVAEP